MLAQSTLVSYHKEDLVKSEMMSTVTFKQFPIGLAVLKYVETLPTYIISLKTAHRVNNNLGQSHQKLPR